MEKGIFTLVVFSLMMISYVMFFIERPKKQKAESVQLVRTAQQTQVIQKNPID
ncbi:hypothetical protein [Sulfurimonas sp. C5]|uniref:hypothetical protein n=1 Tax=Sulfurimonas sp. C5 TaxID=3036947 RepID=UPI0024587233|nr:hypothetical protein [Sulfurimonas sp. C5]MDH4944211.1 hypothetical protein [Sulfurimonas sp. C5]